MEENNDEQSKEQELTKQEKNVLKREQKQKEREKNIRVKKIKKVILWVVFIVIIVGGIYWIVISAEKSNSARPGEAVRILRSNHISASDSHKEYNSNPPTSGSHAGTAQWGFSEVELLDENLIHNIEHGGIWISYKDLDQQSIETLREIARKNSRSVVVTPRAANDSPVAVASWGRLMKLDSVDEEAITEFIRKNKNKSPEQLVI